MAFQSMLSLAAAETVTPCQTQCQVLKMLVCCSLQEGYEQGAGVIAGAGPDGHCACNNAVYHESPGFECLPDVSSNTLGLQRAKEIDPDDSESWLLFPLPLGQVGHDLFL